MRHGACLGANVKGKNEAGILHSYIHVSRQELSHIHAPIRECDTLCNARQKNYSVRSRVASHVEALKMDLFQFFFAGAHAQITVCCLFSTHSLLWVL